MGYRKRADYEGRRILKNIQKGGKWYEIIEYCNKVALMSINQPEKGLDVHLRSDCVHIYYKGGRILEVRTDVLNIDSSYFYLPCEYHNIPRTHMEFIRDGKWQELKKRHVNYEGWTEERAKNVFKELQIQRNNLFGINCIATEEVLRNAYIESAKKPEVYFINAMRIMDEWSDALEKAHNIKHGERLLQQKISLVNKKPEETDYVVIDIEFSVSNAEDCPFRSDDVEFQNHPRFDLIAIQPKNNYRLTVIELKRGLGAVGIMDDNTFTETKSGVINHYDKFQTTVGNDKGYLDFINEMQGVLEMKVKLGILPKELQSVRIPSEKPEFLLAYAGESKERIKAACNMAGLKCICINNEEYPILQDHED